MITPRVIKADIKGAVFLKATGVGAYRAREVEQIKCICLFFFRNSPRRTLLLPLRGKFEGEKAFTNRSRWR